MFFLDFKPADYTAKKILERRGIQSKFDWSVFMNLKPISYFFGIYVAWFFI